ncbi:Fis family transcriptional regulator [Arcobacter arenosus]|jgi:DNA-binding NtrC family response regulator|uniref:Fis family transcriptional regulator n=1 Tax=Arcobacter arenosus TaxID=2576037 RepID=A0A5R8Y1T1_9BACT|nr:Fis family transcriptional regulator [Arcobacter arenosus]TLP38425.1 Fis family transcriptional regulator [Arcobacter arenosus]
MENYIAISKNSKEILNSAHLLQSVEVNALISGEAGVGKKSLAKYILPKAPLFKAKNLQQDIADNIINLQNCSIIIDKIENITNIDLLINWVNENGIRVVATTMKDDLNTKLEELFSITIELPPLKDREEDVKALTSKFSKEASSTLDLDLIVPSRLMINISNNAHSLRKSIYFSYLFETIGEDEILMFMENYMFSNMEGENSYKDFLYLLEVPMLKAATKKYKSQVQMAKHLGLNRITLRKKLDSHKEFLDG